MSESDLWQDFLSGYDLLWLARKIVDQECSGDRSQTLETDQTTWKVCVTVDDEPECDDASDLTQCCEEIAVSKPPVCNPDQPGAEVTCDDGIDNDCDGLTDSDDVDCQCMPTEDTETACEDGIDNDCDDLTDSDDVDCQGTGPFLRGDCDGNGTVGGSPTEAIVLLTFAFRGGDAPGCLAACDAEANGTLGITDALRILRHSFLGLGEPDPPFPDCVKSTVETDELLGCEVPSVCP